VLKSKPLKLVTFAVVTVLLMWTTYPTWRDLVAPSAGTFYDKGDYIWILTADPLLTSVSVSAAVYSSDQRVHQRTAWDRDRPRTDDPYFSTVLAIQDVGEYQDAAGSNSGTYVVAKNQGRELFRQCLYTNVGEVRPYEVPIENLPAEVRASSPQPSSAISAYFLPRGIMCEISLATWNWDQQHYTFALPDLALIKYTVTDNTSEPLQPHPSLPAANCIRVNMLQGSGITTDFEFPDGSDAGIDEFTFAKAREWRTCYSADSSTNGIRHLTSQMTDANRADSISRSLFFAGVFAGILGALGIEILNSGFEWAEAGLDHRRSTRRDEQEQRPDPTPEPPPPPDDEVDRDQLPLF
jgi:hypothetical protein